MEDGPAARAPSQCHQPLHVPHTTALMPGPGFGVYRIPPAACKEACLVALEAGYRHIDCAQLYRSEPQVGDAVRESSVPRSGVFLTTKIKSASRQRSVYEQLLCSVENIGGNDGYVDLFLIHTAKFDRQTKMNVWKALEQLHAKGRAKAIGVSNYHIDHIEEMKEYASIWPPHVNQIELHPWCQQRELVQYCQSNGVVIQAYSPLATGTRLADPTLNKVASRHGKSPAQVLIRYSLQKGWVPLPKSQTPSRIKQNIVVFDFDLAGDEMEMLDALDEGGKGALFPANVS